MKRAPIDWSKVYERLRASEAALHEAIHASDARVQSTFRQRARQLAQVHRQDPAASPGIAVLTFRIAHERYAIELTELTEVMPYRGCRSVPGASPVIPGVISLRGELKPVMDLGLLMNRTAGNGTGFLIIPRRLPALQVEIIEGLEDIQPSALARPESGSFVRGVTQNALMLLDVEALVASLNSPRS